MSKKKVKKNNPRPKGAGDDQRNLQDTDDDNKDWMNSCCITVGKVFLHIS